MKYYVVADVHAYYSIMYRALETAGFFSDPEPHILIALGDFFDRGPEPKETQQFLLDLMAKNAVILIRGNHDDLFEELATKDHGLPYSHHILNGTYESALVLTGFDPYQAKMQNYAFAEAIKQTPLFAKILPAMRDYYETKQYVFVHGWIPTFHDGHEFWENPNWRDATPTAWKMARWYNGMDLAPTTSEKKTVVCGHWHCSYGHFRIEGKGSEFGADADYTPFYGRNVIGIDACTARSGSVNVLVLND